MKILIITQSVDKKNPVLGFFHRWIEEFSKKFENIVVICLEQGEHTLPSNVKVLSLGKEKGKSRLKYFWNFYKYIWGERKNYDAVFVHMNQEYVLLGWKSWWLLRKKIYLWRNHTKGNWLTSLAVLFCKRVFCTSKFSYTAKYKKTVIMPVGIDTEVFKVDNFPQIRKENSILFLGRIAPIKAPDLLIDALIQIKNLPWILSIVGNAYPKDADYYENLKQKVLEEGLQDKIKFLPGISNLETPAIYSAHDIFVNISPSGLYDKTIFEAALCGCLLLVSNENLRGEINDIFIFDRENPEELVLKLKTLLALGETEKETYQKELRAFAEKHDLHILSEKLFDIISRK